MFSFSGSVAGKAIQDCLQPQFYSRAREGTEVRLERIQGVAAFREMREAWNALLAESAADTVFLTWEWLYTWFKHLKRDEELAIFRLSSKGQTVGLVPLLFRSRLADRALGIRVADFLGMRTGGSDYLDAIVRRGWEERALTSLERLTEDRRLIIRARRAKNEGSFIALWAARLAASGWRVATNATDVCPYIRLAARSWESYLESAGRQHRTTVQRKLRNLSKNFELRFERVNTEAERRQALPLLIDMHNLRWEERGGSAAFCTSGLIAFHDEFTRLALARGWLRLFTLRLNGRPAASLYGLLYNRVFYFYQSGLDPSYARHSVGLVAMALAIQSAIEEGAEEYDFLHGDEAYKSHWAQDVRHVGHLVISPPGLAGEIYQAAGLLDKRARKLARRAIPEKWADGIASGLRTWKGLRE